MVTTDAPNVASHFEAIRIPAHASLLPPTQNRELLSGIVAFIRDQVHGEGSLASGLC
jgi:hypothetical protein